MSQKGLTLVSHCIRVDTAMAMTAVIKAAVAATQATAQDLLIRGNVTNLFKEIFFTSW